MIKIVIARVGGYELEINIGQKHPKHGKLSHDSVTKVSFIRSKQTMHHFSMGAKHNRIDEQITDQVICRFGQRRIHLSQASAKVYIFEYFDPN
ncbi:hypothetical protein BpHYR1_001968 [Brachionus plicatilis]|uniref:Uncharacterized protein n=1 Tax=Brachionus plicatilis TaxID=10195 RepID=A0A3M7RT34_BRAPC|nr:hypothetical protein BpHYR1_001968 [Brachionus plicatilis]